MPTAILIDGAYFVRRFRAIEPHNANNADRAAECAFRWAVAHLREARRASGERGGHRLELYRIFFYDCPPIEKKLHNPITKKSIDFGISPEANFRNALHKRMSAMRKVALRLGHLSSDIPWTIKPDKIDQLLKGKLAWADLTESDVIPAARQKGVDMRIGIDIASLAHRRLVDQIVLVAGDADFVPAAKLARREGVDFVLDPMWRSVSADLNLHIDGLRSTCPRPPTAAVNSPAPAPAPASAPAPAAIPVNGDSIVTKPA